MKASRSKKMVCSGCCPAFRVPFELRVLLDEAGEFVWSWVCPNCGHSVPKKTYRPRNVRTPSQKEVVDYLESQGWVVTGELIGRKLWVTFERRSPARSTDWFAGNRGCGTVGPNGKFSLTLYRLFGDKVATQWWHLRGSDFALPTNSDA